MVVMRAFLTTLLILMAVGLLTGCGALPAELPRGFAIIYGVAAYSDINDLRYPDNDATDLYALLTAPEQGFDPADVILRLDADATKENLDDDFLLIASRIAALPDPSRTRFLFYFAGHGYGDGMTRYYSFPEPWRDYFDDPQYSSEPQGAGMYTDYIFLHEISIDGPATVQEVGTELQRSAESDDDLALHMKLIPSRQKMVVIDACHSGGFIGDGTATDSVPSAYDGDETGISFIDGLTALTIYAENNAREPNDVGSETVVITAAGEQEFSYEYGPAVGIENGIFTHYLLESPSNADTNFDGFVTVSEAYNHTVRSIDAIENPYLTGEDKFIPRLGSAAIDFVLFKAR
jgi:caspase domain-containing protein